MITKKFIYTTGDPVAYSFCFAEDTLALPIFYYGRFIITIKL